VAGYSSDRDLERYEKRVLELSVDGSWRTKHDLAKEDIDLMLKGKGVDIEGLTDEGRAQLKKAACYCTLFYIFDELSSLGSEFHAARRDDYKKRFVDEINNQLAIGVDTGGGEATVFNSGTIRLRR